MYSFDLNAKSKCHFCVYSHLSLNALQLTKYYMLIHHTAYINAQVDRGNNDI